MKNNNIIYVGQLWEGGTCLDRMRVLESMSVHILPFDITAYFTNNRFFRSIAHRFNYSKNIHKLNNDLLEFVKSRSENITYFWVDKGRWIFPETLATIKNITNAKLIHYTPDPQLLIHKSRYFDKSISLYDHVITTKPFERNLYKERGAKDVIFTYQSYDSNRFYPRRKKNDYLCDVSLIGHYRPYYAETILYANEATNNIKIWGTAWNKPKFRYRNVMKFYQGGPVLGDEYPIAISSSKICLGLLDKSIPETTTTRTFEIPACGTFLLAERTNDHLDIFEEHKEAEFFSSMEEMVDKIKYYLIHEKEREVIAKAGRERCLKSGYDTFSRLNKIINEIDSL